MQKQLNIRFFLLAFFSFIITLSLHAQPDLNQPLKIDTSFTKGQLHNGLTYYIKPNGKPENKVELRLVVKAGSIQEQDNQQGLAHFMEHMAFNGLKNYPKNELIDALQKMGVRFGADLNANTSWDRTYYLLPIPTDDPDNIETGFRILGDWAGGALISTDEVNKERKVILEELRLRHNNAQARMGKKFLPSLLNNSRYAYREAGGKDSIVLHADPELIREFYRDWYRPDLMAVIVVGDIEVKKAKSLIEKYFAKLKNPDNEKTRIIYKVDPYTSKNAKIVTDSEATNYVFNLTFPSRKKRLMHTVEDYRNEFIGQIFAQCLNNKFQHMSQSANPPFTNAGFSLKGTFGVFTMQNEGFELNVAPINDLSISINAALGELVNVASFGFSAAEVKTAKNAFLPYYESAYKERYTTVSATYTNAFLEHFMKETPLLGIENKYYYIKEFLPTITEKDINTYAKRILKAPSNFFTMVNGPVHGKLSLPTEPQLIKMVEKAFSQTPLRTESIETATALLEKEPVSGKIVSQIADKDLGTITYTLSNGVKVTIKSTDFQKDQVLFSGVKLGGTGLYGVKDKSTVTFLSSVIGTMGYGQFTPTELNDYLSGKDVNVSIGMNEISDVMHGSSSVTDLETMLQLAYLKLMQPRKDTSLLRGLYKKLAAQLPLLMAKPENAFRDTLFKVLYQGNPLSPIVVPKQQDIDQIDVDKAISIYKEQFSNADGFHFFLVGNIDEKTIKPLLEKYLGGLPTKGTAPVYKDNGLRMVKGNHRFNFYHGSDQKSIALAVFHGEMPYSPQLKLKADILTQIMTNKILKVIREKMQAIYSGAVSSSVEKYPYEHYSIITQMPCGPENVESVFKELGREVQDYQNNGVEIAELSKVKKAILEKYKEQLKENSLWLSELQQILFWGQGKSDFLNYEQRVRKVSSEDIQHTAQQLLGSSLFKSASYPTKK